MLMADYLAVPSGGYVGQDLLWIADAALCCRLPPCWQQLEAPDGAPFFYNTLSHETCWEHPQMAFFRGIAWAAQRAVGDLRTRKTKPTLKVVLTRVLAKWRAMQ